VLAASVVVFVGVGVVVVFVFVKFWAVVRERRARIGRRRRREGILRWIGVLRF
jgi:hypothetical protein